MKPLWALLVALVAVVSCTPDGGAPVEQPTAAASALPQALATPGDRAPIPASELLQPLTGLGPCKEAPAPRGPQRVEGLIMPPDAVLVSVTTTGPFTNVQGYIPMTPVQMRVYYQQHPGLRIVSVEDESIESEVLVDRGPNRIFVKAQAVCELGSNFVAVIAPRET
jgi:hypothetical protein